MLLEQIRYGPCRTYVIGCERSGRAMVLDPVLEDLPRVLAYLDRKGLGLDLVVDTHTHADFVSGGAELSERTGAPYALHQSTESSRPNERLREGQVLEVGDTRVEILHTPGHTPDSISLKAGPNLFTGDFLFLAHDGAGRTDLPGGDPGAHWDSLAKLARFGDETRVWPGHDYNELTDSTLGVERVRNPRFQHISRDEYVAWQRAVAQETPAWMLDIIATNLGSRAAHETAHAPSPVQGELAALAGECAQGGACTSGPMGCVPQVSPAESHRRRTSGHPPFLLDVREPWEFSGPTGRHAPGAKLVPLGQLPYRLAEIPQDKDAELHVICRSGGRSAQAVLHLIANGWRRVFNVATGTDGWVAAGLPVES